MTRAELPACECRKRGRRGSVAAVVAHVPLEGGHAIRMEANCWMHSAKKSSYTKKCNNLNCNHVARRCNDVSTLVALKACLVLQCMRMCFVFMQKIC